MGRLDHEIELDSTLNLLIYSSGGPLPERVRQRYGSYFILCAAAQDEYGHGPDSAVLQLDDYLYDAFGVKSLSYRPLVRAYIVDAEYDCEVIAKPIQTHFYSLSFQLYIGVSPVYTDLSDLKQAVETAYEVMKSAPVDLAVPIPPVQYKLRPANGGINTEQMDILTNCILTADVSHLQSLLESYLLQIKDLNLGGSWPITEF